MVDKDDAKKVLHSSSSSSNALKEYLQKYCVSKMWFLPYLPNLLIDDLGIIIGADQVSTNQKLSKINPT